MRLPEVGLIGRKGARPGLSKECRPHSAMQTRARAKQKIHDTMLTQIAITTKWLAKPAERGVANYAVPWHVAQDAYDASNTNSDIHQRDPDVQNAFKILSILGIPHFTMGIAVRCVLPRSPNQGIHRCRYRGLSCSPLDAISRAEPRQCQSEWVKSGQRELLPQFTAYVCVIRMCE